MSHVSGSKTPYIEAFALARSPNLLAALPLAHRFGLHKKNTYWLSYLICGLILALGFDLLLAIGSRIGVSACYWLSDLSWRLLFALGFELQLAIGSWV